MSSYSVVQVDPWEQAKNRFLEGLSDEYKYLYRSATPENIFYGASSMNIIHAENSTTRTFIRKIQPFIKRVEQYGKALDVYSNTAALPLCPLWGTIRVFIIIAEGYDKYFQKLVDMLVRIGDMLPNLSVYVDLFPTHQKLRHAISEIYLEILVFCTKAKELFYHPGGHKTPWGFKSRHPGWKDFDREFVDTLENFRRHSRIIEKQVDISHMLEAATERELAKRARAEKELAKKGTGRLRKNPMSYAGVHS